MISAGKVARSGTLKELPDRIRAELKKQGWRMREHTCTLFYLDENNPSRRLAISVKKDGSWNAVAQQDWTDALWEDWEKIDHDT